MGNILQTPREEAVEFVNGILNDKIGITQEVLDNVQDEEYLSDIGVDSLDACEVCVEIERHNDASISDSILAECDTYGKLIDMYINSMRKK